MAISRRLRFEILRRDGHTCRYCGAKAPDVALQVDHVIPVTLGGGDDPTNLVAACAACNSGKTSVPADAALVADVDAAALLFARAAGRAAEIRRAELGALDELLGLFDATWNTYGCSVPRSAGWATSVETFLARGLSLDELFRYVDVAMTSRVGTDQVWRYFCGCCWREIGDRDELARRLIEDGAI